MYSVSDKGSVNDLFNIMRTDGITKSNFKECLHHTICLGLIEPTRTILNKFSIDLEEEDRYGHTILMRVVAHLQNVEMARLLIQCGAYIHTTYCSSKYTPLVYAGNNSNLEMTMMLVENGADVNSLDRSGCTPIFHANCEKVVEFLLESGADVNHKNKNGETPLIHTTKINIARKLVKYGADLTVVDSEGFTAMTSEEERRKKVIEYLKTVVIKETLEPPEYQE